MDNGPGKQSGLDRTFRQIAMCLLAGGRGEALEELVARGISEPFGSYCLALKSAHEGKVDKALEQLRSCPAGEEDLEMRQLAFRLLIHQANLCLPQEDFVGLSRVLDEALRIMPNTPEAEQELASFPQILPFCYLYQGSRKKTATMWRRDLWELDDRALHKLALLYYWSARQAEEKQISEGSLAPESLDALWQKTIAYWVALAGSKEFWERWTRRRVAVYGGEISSEAIDELRNKLLEDRLVGLLHQFMDTHQQAGRREDSLRHHRYLTRLQLERRAAATWRRLLPRLTGVNRALNLNLTEPVSLAALVRAMQTKEGNQPCFASDGAPGCRDCSWERLCRLGDLKPDLPMPFKNLGGPLMNREMGLAGLITRILLLQLEYQRDDADAERLATYLSPLGIAAVWLEEKHPEQTLQELERLKVDIRRTPRARYVWAAALAERGRRSMEAQGLEAAFKDWQEVKQVHQELVQGRSHTVAFQQLLARLLNDLTVWVTEGALREARGLKAQKKTNEAIHILKKAMELATSPEMADHLADLYCDRAHKVLIDKKYPEAREDFENALKVKPGFNRAREGMSIIYHNEGIDALNQGRLDEGMRLLERALEYSPDSKTKSSLAAALRGKAVKKYNNEFDRAYSLQEKIAVVVAALELLKRAHELDPFNEQIVKDLNYLADILRRLSGR